MATQLSELHLLYDVGHQWVQAHMKPECETRVNLQRGRWQRLFDLMYPIFMEKKDRFLIRPRTHPNADDAPLYLFSIFDQFQGHIIHDISEII